MSKRSRLVWGMALSPHLRARTRAALTAVLIAVGTVAVVPAPLHANEEPYIFPGETKEYVVYVDGSEFTVSAKWESKAATVYLSLIDPSGAVIDSTNAPAGVTVNVQEAFVYFEVPDPAVGEWKVIAYGADVSEAGEWLWVNPWVEPYVNEVPTGAIAVTQDGATVSVSPQDVVDPDGEIVEYMWEFGDGGTAYTEEASYTYPVAGTWDIMLVVKDDKGDRGYLTGPDSLVEIPESATRVTKGAGRQVPHWNPQWPGSSADASDAPDRAGAPSTAWLYLALATLALAAGAYGVVRLWPRVRETR